MVNGPWGGGREQGGKMRTHFLAGMVFCLVGLVIGAPGASGSLVNRTVNKCEADATWQVTLSFGSSYADVTRTTGTGPGCRTMNATVESDGNFSFTSGDNGYSDTIRYELVGAGVTGNSSFAGVATRTDGAERGPIVIVGGTSLTATVAGAGGLGEAVVEYYPAGTCGANCYRTRAVWEGSWGGP